MAGYPAGPYQAPPPQYGPPPANYGQPAQQYGPPPQQYSQPPQQYGPPPGPASADDFAQELIGKYKGLTKAAREIVKREERAERRQQGHSGGETPALSFTEWQAGLALLTEAQLEREFHRWEPGTPQHRALVMEHTRRDEEAEFNDAEFEEEELMDVYGVYVDDGATGWVQVTQRTQVTGMEELMDQLRQSHPYATRMKHGKVVRLGRIIHQGAVSKTLRSADEARANLERDKRMGRVENPGLPAPAPPPAGLSSEMQILFKGITDNNNALIQAVLAKDSNKGSFLETIQVVKEMMVEPMIRMVEAQKQPPGDPNLSINLAKTMMDGSVQLSKLQQASGGGGGSGMLDTISSLVERFGPLLQQQTQQPQRPALPAPNEMPPAPGADMQHTVATNIGAALDALIKGRMVVEQLPKFAVRNLKEAGVNHVLTLGVEGFAALVRQVVIQKGLPQAYFSRQDIQLGFVWVYEEISRIAIVSNWLEQHGRLVEKKQLSEWSSPTIVPWRESSPIVGDEAFYIFSEAYPNIAAGADLDLPPPPEQAQISMHEPAPAPQAQRRPAPPARQAAPRPAPAPAPNLRVVPPDELDQDIDFVPVDPFGGAPDAGPSQPAPRAQPAPRRHAPSEPDFA